MHGYGFRMGFMGTVPPWPYVGKGKGGMPRCWWPSWKVDNQNSMNEKDELRYLKQRANVLNEELRWIEERIKTLEGQA